MKQGKLIKTKLKDSQEPLIELLFQEFPNKDPREIEHIIKVVIKWMEQRINDTTAFKKALREQSENIDLEPLHDPIIIHYLCQ